MKALKIDDLPVVNVVSSERLLLPGPPSGGHQKTTTQTKDPLLSKHGAKSQRRGSLGHT